jgi:hypothetical protein
VNEGDLGTIVYHRLAADASKENAGDDITLTASYTANGNYDVTVIDGKLTIGKRTLTITVGDGNKTYGEADPAFEVKVEGAAAADTIETPGTKREPGDDVGTYEVTADIDEAELRHRDREGELTSERSVTILDDKTKTYGDVTVFTALTRLVNKTIGDDHGVLRRSAKENAGDDITYGVVYGERQIR